MNQDLKTIKKKYGEEMMHFCRENFSSLLETEGLLSYLLLEHFYPSHILFEDIQKGKLESDFKNYIYNLVDVENNNEIIINKTPEELLSEAGYNLFECTTESDIQSFRKYYAKGEELCTFNRDRLDTCYVFFAIKKDVDEIKREDYKNPKRQDKYGTSVISIQFTRDENHTLSIKNRYNHTVNNPDATFSNNLDNIIPGLTESFEREYGLIQKYKNNDFEIPHYTKAEGKYYKFNHEINNTCYCPDNIVIENFKAKQYEKEKYIVFEYFILDLVNKEISLYDERINDFFPNMMKEIEKIKIENKKETKEIYITPKIGKDIVITLDKENRMIVYKNENVFKIGNDFLFWNKTLKEIDLPKVEKIENNFLVRNEKLRKISLPSVEKIGNNFLYHNQELTELILPKAKEIGCSFLLYNTILSNVYLPNLETLKYNFLCSNNALQVLELPKLKNIGGCFLEKNRVLKLLSIENVEFIGDNFLLYNKKLEKISLPKLQIAGHNFLLCNPSLKKISIPENAIIMGNFIEAHQGLFEKLEKVKQKKI